MLGRAFLQCILDEETHRLLHEKMDIPMDIRNTMRENATGSPFSAYWLADIHYDAFGHLHFFGLEADLAELAGQAGNTPGLPETLSAAFAGALALAFGIELASRMPKLADWDCNTLQYTAELDDQGVYMLPEKLRERAGWPAIIQNGKHAAGAAATLDFVQHGGRSLLVATCRRSKLNALLAIKGLDRRPLFRLLEEQTASKAIASAIKTCIGIAAVRDMAARILI